MGLHCSLFLDVLLQRVVSVPDGCLGVATIGQRVVNALPQCIPLTDVEAHSSQYGQPSWVPRHFKDPTAESVPHLVPQFNLLHSCSCVFL